MSDTSPQDFQSVMAAIAQTAEGMMQPYLMPAVYDNMTGAQAIGIGILILAAQPKDPDTIVEVRRGFDLTVWNAAPDEASRKALHRMGWIAPTGDIDNCDVVRESWRYFFMTR